MNSCSASIFCGFAMRKRSWICNPELTRVDSIGWINGTEEMVLALISASELPVADNL